MFSDDKLKFYVLHFSVWEDLWPYSNAYLRPGTRARFKSKNVSFVKISIFSLILWSKWIYIFTDHWSIKSLYETLYRSKVTFKITLDVGPEITVQSVSGTTPPSDHMFLCWFVKEFDVLFCVKRRCKVHVMWRIQRTQKFNSKHAFVFIVLKLARKRVIQPH